MRMYIQNVVYHVGTYLHSTQRCIIFNSPYYETYLEININ